MYRIALTFFSIITILSAQAQDTTNRFSRKYPFIHDNLNVISNDSTSLFSFYLKLQHLKTGKDLKVTIAHIGDSHIQADMMSGKIREKLQHDFGNAGRGLIFPYKVAKTNGPFDVHTKSNVVWEIKRIVSSSNPMPSGVTGITICSYSDTSRILIKVKSKDLDYRFNTVKLFHDQNPDNYDLMITDTAGRKLGYIKSSKLQNDTRVTTLKLDTLLSEIIIKSVKTDTIQKSTQLYGISLENEKSGILYDMMGVNGAQYFHFNRASYFFEQLNDINPDLILISLGTNDSFGSHFDSTTFRNNVTCMIDNIRAYMPNTCILLMFPPDSFKKKKVKNTALIPAVAILTDICRKDNIAYWDLFHIMGGSGSMAKWLGKKLGQKDKVHYTMPGYELQADMFYKALMDGFFKFEHRH